MLTTYVRTKLVRTICTRYRDDNNVLNVVMLDPALENQIRAALKYMTSATIPGLIVLSQAEITHDTQVVSVGFVTL